MTFLGGEKKGRDCTGNDFPRKKGGLHGLFRTSGGRRSVEFQNLGGEGTGRKGESGRVGLLKIERVRPRRKESIMRVMGGTE